MGTLTDVGVADRGVFPDWLAASDWADCVAAAASLFAVVRSVSRWNPRRRPTPMMTAAIAAIIHGVGPEFPLAWGCRLGVVG